MKKDKSATTNADIGATGAAGMAFEPVPEPEISASLIEREEIARLAHAYWEARGCPHGSPEEDWLRAEKDLQRAAGAAA